MKHKHYDLIVAWAEGKKIEKRLFKKEWIDCHYPVWFDNDEYRIKPEPKPKEYYDEDTFDGGYLYVYNHTIDAKTCMFPTLIHQTYGQWKYMGKVRLEK